MSLYTSYFKRIHMKQRLKRTLGTESDKTIFQVTASLPLLLNHCAVTNAAL